MLVGKNTHLRNSAFFLRLNTCLVLLLGVFALWNDATAATLIPQTGWTLQYVDSEETIGEDGAATNAFDGDPNTLWHTEWLARDPVPPHEVQINLGASYAISGFRYLPRSDGTDNGTIIQYAFYISTDGVAWGAAVANGSFAADLAEKEVTFGEVTGQYIRLVALSAINNRPWTTVAELNVLGALAGGNQAPNGTIATPATNQTLTAGDSLSFTGSANDPDGNTPLSYLWSFGDPAITDSTALNPGTVQFNTPGTYTVTFTVTDGLGLADTTPATRVVTVLGVGENPLISKTLWTIKYADSEEVLGEDARASYAIDGNASTFWHTEWLLRDPGHSHEIIIDLGEIYFIDGIRQLPTSVGNGRIRDYHIYVSTNGYDWATPVATGRWQNTSSEKSVLFSPKLGQFVKIVAINEVNGNPWTSLAEIDIEGRKCTPSSPYLKLQLPYGYIQTGNVLQAIASVCFDAIAHLGWGVRFEIDGGAQVIVDTVAPYTAEFTGLGSTEHVITAYVVNNAGVIVTGDNVEDFVASVGVGNYYIAIGDSITAGFGDDYKGDDISNDGRDREGGYTAVLNNILTISRGTPQKIAMEGRPGDTTTEIFEELTRILGRHTGAQAVLLLAGTNDSSIPLPSGEGLVNGQSGYPGSYKEKMQKIIDLIVSSGKQVYIAKLPYTLIGSTRNTIISGYNRVIDELVLENGIAISPPDFYDHFANNTDQMSDSLHPNGTGYQSMADLWSVALP